MVRLPPLAAAESPFYMTQFPGGGQHYFIFQLRPGRRPDGFKRLQWIRHDPGANDDLVCGAHVGGIKVERGEAANWDLRGLCTALCAW